MLLKEMIMKTDISEILDVYYKHFNNVKVDDTLEDKFLENLISLLEVDYSSNPTVEGNKIVFRINELLGSNEHYLNASYKCDSDSDSDRYALYSVPHEVLANMQVEKPEFLDDADAICVIVDDALGMTL